MTDDNVSAVPLIPQSLPYNVKTTKSVKAATPDIVLFNEEAQPVEAMSGLIFENIGGQEIINISRTDIIDGKNVDYSLISNLNQVNSVYGPKNMLNVPGTLDQYFKNFAIRLETHVPESGTGPGGAIVYIDETNIDPVQKNRIVIDVVAMEKNEQVEIQVLQSGKYLDDIIEFLEES